MQIELPDHLDLATRAERGGFDSIEAYIVHLVKSDSTTDPDAEPDPNKLPRDEWKRRFEKLCALAKPIGAHNVDVSRESMYPVRD